MTSRLRRLTLAHAFLSAAEDLLIVPSNDSRVVDFEISERISSVRHEILGAFAVALPTDRIALPT